MWLWEILEFNEIQKDHMIEEGAIVLFRMKKSRGVKDFHIVKDK